MIKLVLDGIPKAVQSFRFTKQGRRYQPKETIDWKNFIKLQTLQQLPDDFEMYKGAIALDVEFDFPPLKSWPKKKLNILENGGLIYKTSRPDLQDNLMKGMSDALTGIVWKDDAQIAISVSVKKYALSPKTIVKIEEL